MNKKYEIRKLKKMVRKCRKCPGLNIKKPNIALMGQGNPDARLMFVAQSPCELCALKQKIFYKGSGVILDKGLKRINESRKTVYVTNVCKCHTPNNRRNTASEIQNCREYLEKEIEIVEPEIIVALGKEAYKWFKCSEWGEMEKRENYYVYALAHPAFIIRRPYLLDEYLKEWDVLKPP